MNGQQIRFLRSRGELDGLHTSKEVCRLAGVTFRRLDYWIRNGVLVPAREAQGSGTVRLFDDRAVDVARLLDRVACTGALTSTALRAAVAHVRTHGLYGVVPVTDDRVVLVDLDQIRLGA